ELRFRAQVPDTRPARVRSISSCHQTGASRNSYARSRGLCSLSPSDPRLTPWAALSEVEGSVARSARFPASAACLLQDQDEHAKRAKEGSPRRNRGNAAART